MEYNTMACRHLGQFFKLAIEYNLDEVDFTLKALNSHYKVGIENYIPQWYSQSQYYYFEEFIEENEVEKFIYSEEDKLYEVERMYWMGYCMQAWSNRTTLKGSDIARIYGVNGVKQLLDNYKVYHTVDPMVVLEDTLEINNINIDFEEILIS